MGRIRNEFTNVRNSPGLNLQHSSLRSHQSPIFPFLNQLNNCSRRKASKKNRTLLFLLQGSGDKRTSTTRSLPASSPSCWSVTQHSWILRKLQPRWSLYEPTLLQN